MKLNSERVQVTTKATVQPAGDSHGFEISYHADWYGEGEALCIKQDDDDVLISGSDYATFTRLLKHVWESGQETQTSAELVVDD